MAQNSKIEWTDATWNFLRGCSRISRGCGDGTGGGCYAESMARRFSGKGQPYEGTISERGKWNGNITFHEDKLLEALKWKKPQRVFVNSMSDLFHENVKDEWIDKAFAVMALTPHITYQILTKRPERMAEYIQAEFVSNRVFEQMQKITPHRGVWSWPTWATATQNIWLGCSIEDQKTADERIPHLLNTPAAVRFLSVEPLLGEINLQLDSRNDTGRWDSQGNELPLREIVWIIVGTESGTKRRPAKLEWIESIVDQCKSVGVPVFVKQISINNKVSHDMSEWPEHLRIREFPRT